MPFHAIRHAFQSAIARGILPPPSKPRPRSRKGGRPLSTQCPPLRRRKPGSKYSHPRFTPLQAALRQRARVRLAMRRKRLAEKRAIAGKKRKKRKSQILVAADVSRR